MAAKEVTSSQLYRAVSEARRIRKGLMKTGWKANQMAGACGLASILLSIALKDVTILRGTTGHIWAEVQGTIVDITATQFNSFRTYKHDPPVRGVLVTRTPRGYHQSTTTGMKTYLSVINNKWYSEEDHPCWKWISEYWLEDC